MEKIQIWGVENYYDASHIYTDFGEAIIKGQICEGMYSYKEILPRLMDSCHILYKSFLKNIIEYISIFPIENIYNTFLAYIPSYFYEYAVNEIAIKYPDIKTNPVILYTYYQKEDNDSLVYTYREVLEMQFLKEKVIQLGKAKVSSKDHQIEYKQLPKLESAWITLLPEEEAINYLKKYIGKSRVFRLLQYFSIEKLLEKDLLELISSYPHFIYALLLSKDASLRNDRDLWERNFGIDKKGFLQASYLMEMGITYKKQDLAFISSYSTEELKRKVFVSYYPISVLETYIWPNIPDQTKEDLNFQKWFMEYYPLAYETFYEKKATYPSNGRLSFQSSDGKLLSSRISWYRANGFHVSEDSFRFLSEMSKKDRASILFTPYVISFHLKKLLIKYIDFEDIDMARGLLLQGEVKLFLEEVPAHIQRELIEEYLEQKGNPYLLYDHISYVLKDIPDSLLMALIEYPKKEEVKRTIFYKMYRQSHSLLEDPHFVEEYILPYKDRIFFIENMIRKNPKWIQEKFPFFPYLEAEYNDLFSYTKKEGGKICIHPNLSSYDTFERDMYKIRDLLNLNHLTPNSSKNLPLEDYECRFLIYGHLLEPMYEKYYPKYEKLLLQKYPNGDFHGKDNFYDFLQFFVPKKTSKGTLKAQNLSVLYGDKEITEVALTTFRDLIDTLDKEGAKKIDTFFLYKRKQSLELYNGIVRESFTGKNIETILTEKGLCKDTLLADILSLKGLWKKEKEGLLALLNRNQYQVTVGDILSILDEMDKRELTIDEILEEREFSKKVFYQIYRSALESNPALYGTIKEYLKQNKKRGFKKYVNFARVILSLPFSSMEEFKEHFPDLDLEKMINRLNPYYPSISASLQNKLDALKEGSKTYTKKRDYV